MSLLHLFDLCDGVRSHPSQRVFGLVAKLFGQLGEVLSVFPCYPAAGREEMSKTGEKIRTETGEWMSPCTPTHPDLFYASIWSLKI